MENRRSRINQAGWLLAVWLLAHALGAQDRITLPINDDQRAPLPGHVSPRIKSAVDQGLVDPSMELSYVTLVLKPSAAQQADLDELLAQQQEPSSPNYHRWLTPEQYADRFGATQADIDKILGWLASRELTVKSVARGRNTISFAGSASRIESAFGVQLHHYLAGSELHFANAADPAVPMALQGVVGAIHGLHDFRLKPMSRHIAQPLDTVGTHHYLAPDDVATIYDITALYNAGIDGTGQTLAIAGQTEIKLSDIEAFRTFFNLPANNPTTMLVPGSSNPGIQANDLSEADLDLELSGAVARKAQILFVYSSDVIDAFQYAIDQKVAPVVSISYGGCELLTSPSDVTPLQTSAQQGNAQGVTIFAAAGDDGAADCFDSGDSSTNGLPASVDLPAALPEVTGVGGSEFNEGSKTDWSPTNTANKASALGYIPEIGWNDSASNGSPFGGGGGVSIYFSKPIWQTGTGVPNDGARDVPDVSISASLAHDGYFFYTAGSLASAGGTSVGSPQYAGIAALVNQYLVKKGFQSKPGLGNINQALYIASLAATFHDITSGNNTVIPCVQPCSLPPVPGYSAAPGYDLLTGLGTPDVNKLVTSWHTAVASKSSPTVTVASSPSSLAFTGTTELTATVTGAGAAPTGQVTFLLGTDSLGIATLSPSSNGTSAATLMLSGVLLATGTNKITAEYFGDSSYYGTTASATVTVTSSATGGAPTINSKQGLLNAASFTSGLAPGGILSVFGTNLAPVNITGAAPSIPLPTMMAGTTVTIDGFTAPLYYVSAAQLNIQIPFDVPANSFASMEIFSNGGQHVFANFTPSAAAPAIFTTNSQGTGQGAILNSSYQLVDGSHPATPGSTYILIYCTGLGAVSNQPPTGAPAPGPPLAETSTLPVVTIGNVPATVVFSGLAPGYVGLYQVNALVPAKAPAGNAVPVVLSMGSATSNTVTIAVASP